MGRDIINLFVLVAVGVIIADLVMPSHLAGTNALFKGISGIWTTSVNGMLGNAGTKTTGTQVV